MTDEKTLELGDVILSHEYGNDDWFEVVATTTNTFHLKSTKTSARFFLQKSRIGAHFGKKADCESCSRIVKMPSITEEQRKAEEKAWHAKFGRCKPFQWFRFPYIQQFQEMPYVNHTSHWVWNSSPPPQKIYQPCQQCYILALEDSRALNHKLYVERLVTGICNAGI